MNYSSNYDFRSVDDITPEDIHITLLLDLRSHFNKENNPYMVDLWIIGMTKYRPYQKNGVGWMTLGTYSLKDYSELEIIPVSRES